jgi:hypothetical protein
LVLQVSQLLLSAQRPEADGVSPRPRFGLEQTRLGKGEDLLADDEMI